jgi:AraC-like DNA-binding protein
LRVAVFVCPRQAAQITAAMESHDEVRVADSWDSLEMLIRVEPLSVVVFNPAADGTMDVGRACGLIRRYGSIPFVAYVPLDAPFMRGIAHMSNDGLQDLIVVRANDSPSTLRNTLSRVSSIQELTILVDELQPLFRRLPVTLAQVLVDALRQPHKYASAEDIAAAAAMTVSGLYRSFRRARMNSPKSYVVGARVFKGYLYLRDAGFSIRDIAAKLGYTHPRIFAHQIECVFGERPSRIRHSLEIHAAVERLVSWFSTRDTSLERFCLPDKNGETCLTKTRTNGTYESPSLTAH